jgi:hypothetical protein
MKKFIHAAVFLAPLALVLANGSAAIAQDAQPQPTPAPTPTPKPPQLPDPSPSGVSTMWQYGYHDGKCWLYEILIQTQGSASKMTIISTIASVREIPCDKVPAGALPPRTATTGGTTTGQSGGNGTGASDSPPPPPPGWPQGVLKTFEGDDEIWTYPDGHKERFRRPKESDQKTGEQQKPGKSAEPNTTGTGGNKSQPHEERTTKQAATAHDKATRTAHASHNAERQTSAPSRGNTMRSIGASRMSNTRMGGFGGMRMGGMHMGGMRVGNR